MQTSPFSSPISRRALLGSALAFASIGSLGLAGCGKAAASASGSAATGSTGKSAVTTIDIGDQPSFYLLKVADKRGFFKDEFESDGIAVNVKNFANAGPAIIEALKADSLELGIVGALPVISADAGGARIVSLASANYVEDQFKVVAGKDSGVHKIEDLKGKKLATSVGTNSHEMLLGLLKKHGVDKSEVEILNLKDADTLPALENGSVAAAAVGNVNALKAEKVGGYEIANNSETGLIINSVVARESFLKDNEDLVVRVLKALKKTDEWIQGHQEETAQIFADASKTDLESARKNLEARKVKVSIDDAYLHDPIERSIEFEIEEGVITKKISPDDIIDTSYAQQAGIEA